MAKYTLAFILALTGCTAAGAGISSTPPTVTQPDDSMGGGPPPRPDVGETVNPNATLYDYQPLGDDDTPVVVSPSPSPTPTDKP